MAARTTTVRVTGNVTEAIAALDALGIKAEETAVKTDAVGAAGKRMGNVFTSTGAKLATWGVPFSGSLTRMGEKITEAEGKGKKLGATLAAVGKMAVTAGVAGFAVVATESIKAATKFQSSMTLLQTAGGEAASNMSTVSNGILNLAKSTGTSTEQLSEGMYTVEKAGIRGAAGLKVLKAAAEGAKAENVDLGTATNALTSVMMSYHRSADQAVSTENQIVAGAGMAKTTMQEYAGSLSTVIPVASAAGVNFSQVAGAIATLTQHGTSAQEATQELANTIRNLQAPSQVAQSAMQQIGLNVNDVSKNLGKRGLTGTIDLITQAIGSKLGPSGLVAVNAFKQSQSAAQDLQAMLGKMPPKLSQLSEEYLKGSVSMKDYRNGIRGMGSQGYALGSQFLSLSNKANGFNDLMKSGQPAAQTMASYLKKVMGGATGLNTALMLGGENMAYFKTATDKVSKAGSQAGSNISTWAKTQKTLQVQLDKMKETVQVLGIKLGTFLIPKLETLLSVIASVVDWFGKHKIAALALAGVIGGVLLAATVAWVASLFAADGALAFLLSPITLVVAAIAALVVGIIYAYNHFAIFREIVQGFVRMWVVEWDVIKAAALDVVHGIVAGIGVFVGIWRTQWNIVKTVINDVWGFLKIFKPAVLAIFTVFDAIPLLIVKYWSKIVGFFRALFRPVEAVFRAATKVLSTVWTAEWDAIKAVLNAAWNDVIRPVFNFIKTVAIDAVKREIQALQTIWHGAWTGIRDVLNGAWNDVIHPVFNFIRTVAIGPLKTAAQGLHDAWSTIWQGIQTAVQDAWKIIKPIIDTMKSALDDIKGAIGGVTGAAKSIGGGIGGAAKSVGSALSSGFGLWADGGWVNAPSGSPVPGVVHGGEYVLSTGMLYGSQPIDPRVVGALANSMAMNTHAAASSGGAVAAAAPTTGAQQQIVVQMLGTTADPTALGNEIGWQLRPYMR